MPGNHSRLNLTVIAFLILYSRHSEKMQEANVRSRNSATSWKFWLSRCQKQGRGHQHSSAPRSAYVQMCKHLIFYHRHVVIRPWSALCASVKLLGRIKRIFSSGSLTFLGSRFCLTACEDEACGHLEMATGQIWQPDCVFCPLAPAE